MLRSRGNRLPRERVPPLFSSSLFSSRSIAPAAPAASRSITSVADANSLSSRSSRISPRRDSSRRVCRARKRIARTRAVSFISSVSIVFIVLWISTPPSSVIAATGARVTRTHTCTSKDALFPRRTAPFFERDSSPISFRSPVIN